MRPNREAALDDFEQALMTRDHVSADALARAKQVGAKAGSPLAATLVRLGMVSEAAIAEAFTACTTYGRYLPAASADPDGAPPWETLNRRFLTRHAAVPLTVEADSVLVAMADPLDEQALAGLRFALGRPITPLIATFSQVEELLATPDTGEESLGSGTGSSDDDLDRLLEGSSEAPVIRLVQRLLANAVARRASDVHIEPMARELRVRYRIDGRLVEVERLSDTLTAPVALRIKVMASLDIAETRLPQDGRLRLTSRGRDVDVRVSTSPTAFGESIVLRLLGRSEVPLDLDRLGLPEPALTKLARALDRPHGIILLTGPTGSGKTTTLYAAINRLRRPEVKILTVEDPVEVMLEGINQVQVRPEIDLSYAATLRAFLRQDPDILMIGEIRDKETAEIAMRAALTGHLVLSTLHTNSAAGAFTRLADIGIEPYLSTSTVIATIAQRLIRGICLECRASRTPSEIELHRFASFGLSPPSTLYDSVGCAACQHSGYRGRMPLIELLEIDETARELVRTGSIEALTARTPPLESLAGHGFALVAAGLTTMAEVERVVDAS